MTLLRIHPQKYRPIIQKINKISTSGKCSFSTRSANTISARNIDSGAGRGVCVGIPLIQRTSTRSTAWSIRTGRSERRTYATATPADAIIEDLTEQYSVARDEFEIASEETSKNSVYAADDRAAAAEELQKLKEMYGTAIAGEYGEEIQRRVGQRVRELEQGILALEERAREDH
ncbi:8738c4bf-648c-4578-b907-4f544332f61f [Sclerotinia trifoliorum]|uniref:8738c4bf-648c-4578-b907-4f544332f61f n=1 Tax=Sclerotinia trifoliorum TaxID=28548 RepID=A0A8H2W1J4_9HELO|nr:8738c4bf-648c-4578-b907-4f544332f61f [Sclerotinia trifoliorum]